MVLNLGRLKFFTAGVGHKGVVGENGQHGRETIGNPTSGRDERLR